MRRLVLIAVTAAVAVAALPVSGASAATQVGYGCAASATAVPERTVFQLASSAATNPLAVPAKGVITSWQVTGNPGINGTLPQWLKILRQVGSSSAYTVVAEDVGLVKGTTSFPTRIPVEAGDRIGLYSEGGVFICSTGAGDQIGAFKGVTPLGATPEFTPIPNFGVPVTATVEPDADGDGFGDETQDQCPRSAKLFEACPAVGIDAVAIQSGASAIVYVAVSGPATVKLTGVATVPGRAGSKVKLSWHGSHSAEAGRFQSFKLKFPAELKGALRAPGAAVQLKLAIAATNVAGLNSSHSLKLKLR